MIQITRTHEICMGHRVMNHEGKCKNLHGHNYIFEFTVRSRISLDSVGRVVDFSEVKSVLCDWLEKNWDHKFMMCKDDPIFAEQENESMQSSYSYYNSPTHKIFTDSVVPVPFNPTAENIADHFLNTVAPDLTRECNWYLWSLKLHETSKCSAFVSLTQKAEALEKNLKKKIPMPNCTYCSLQCGNERNCKCGNETDEMKLKCKYNCNNLPF